jgi:hypothetical protein
VAQALGIPISDVETLEHTRLGLLEIATRLGGGVVCAINISTVLAGSTPFRITACPRRR